MSNRILAIQLAIITLCLLVVAEAVIAFPFPSPFIKPFLPPRLRWPTEQIRTWVEAENFDGDYLRFFARDPERTIPPGENMVSPADGVLQRTPTQNGVTYFVVGLSFWDVHVIRTPVAGTVTNIELEGLQLDRMYEKDQLDKMIYLRGKDAPVQQIVTLRTRYGEIKVRLITSYWASRLKVWVHKGETLQKGERIGRILLGSTVVVDLPGTVPFAVKPLQRVVAGETIIFSGDKLQ